MKPALTSEAAAGEEIGVNFPLFGPGCPAVEGHFKTLTGRCKVFFRGFQFSLAFDPEKSILRSKKRAQKCRCARLAEPLGALEEKK